jgi:hypothetical protein
MARKKAAKPAEPETEQAPGGLPADPANTGPATSHPEASPAGGMNPEHATEDRKARDRAGQHRKPR